MESIPLAGARNGGRPLHRADAERLAIDAYLHDFDSPVPQRFELNLERWFAGTERFARQLREVARDDYITMKRSQYLRQQLVPGRP